MQDAFAHCARLVREADKDRFLASLYAPPALRGGLHALYAFDIEVSRIAARVSEAIAGEVRLQWWREVLDGIRTEDAQAHPVAAALLQTKARYALPRALLDAAVDARTFDLYADPMPSLAAFERYARDTTEGIMRLAAQALGPRDDPGLAALLEHAGAATAMTAALVRFPADASRGRLFLPQEIFERNGAKLDDVFAGRATPALSAALAELRAHARQRLFAARGLIAASPRAVRPAFLHVLLAPMQLARMERRGYDPFKTPAEPPAWRRMWTLWRAARAL